MATLICVVADCPPARANSVIVYSPRSVRCGESLNVPPDSWANAGRSGDEIEADSAPGPRTTTRRSADSPGERVTGSPASIRREVVDVPPVPDPQPIIEHAIQRAHPQRRFIGSPQ